MRQNPKSFQVAPNAYTDVKHVIGVVSGKGGVGKSMVTASLANLLAEMEYRVGISGCGYYRPVHSENVWSEGTGTGI